MTSAGDRFVIAFNGEIYNHLDLRDQLESQVLHLLGVAIPIQKPC